MRLLSTRAKCTRCHYSPGSERLGIFPQFFKITIIIFIAYVINHITLPSLTTRPCLLYNLLPFPFLTVLLHPVALTESPFIHFSLTAWLFFKKEKFTTYPLDYLALNLTILLTFLGPYLVFLVDTLLLTPCPMSSKLGS